MEVLSTLAVDRVASWLAVHGWVRRERRLGLTGWRQSLVSTEFGLVAWRPGRLVTSLAKASDEELTGEDLTLTALLDGVGFARQGTEAFRPWAGGRSPEEIGRLLAAWYPPVAEVCGRVQALAAWAASPH